MKIITLIALLVSTAYGADDWLCKSQASERHGSEIYACGIGEGATEDLARANAFDASRKEFDKLCSASTDCKGQAVTADPRRSDCTKEAAGYRCYRLIVWSVGTAAGSGNLPKEFIKKGMTSKELIAFMGMPTTILKSCRGGDQNLFLYKNNDKCTRHDCSVCFYYGKVDSWNGFKPQFTEDVR